VSAPPLTAARAGLIRCADCELLSRAPPTAGKLACPRCGATLHQRKPNSIQRTWALLISAYILYVPANLLPMMKTSSPRGTENDTIMSGVVYLWSSGSWPLALLVFLASITIPGLKLLSMTLLAWSVQRRSVWQPEQRARLYRLVEIVGRWSMLDVYVVTIMAALVQMQPLASIEAGPAAVAFGAVVVLTLLAASSFDPRLIWDPLGDHHD
jgi:paraquat-inducible protein A